MRSKSILFQGSQDNMKDRLEYSFPPAPHHDHHHHIFSTCLAGGISDRLGQAEVDHFVQVGDKITMINHCNFSLTKGHL